MFNQELVTFLQYNIQSKQCQYTGNNKISLSVSYCTRCPRHCLCTIFKVKFDF